MKFSAILLAAAAGRAAAQTIEDSVPVCAVQCLLHAQRSTNCQVGDVSCFCINLDRIRYSAAPCVRRECGDDVALVRTRLHQTKPSECPDFFSHHLDADEGKAAATASGAAPIATNAEDSSAGSLVAGLGAVVSLVLAAVAQL
ncbi:hypothetical protein N0V85_004564 [Neurospora sp. IMI 360204]|nr:hypothetical protein N0V85_004564 [Neurospora sp. IMI 360204]